MALRPYIFSHARLARAPAEALAATRLLQIKPPAKILDLCCGIGIHSAALARLGFSVVGVDICGPLIAEARARAEEAGLPILFTQGDMASFCLNQECDAVLNLFTSFGYNDTEEQHRACITHIHKSLRAGGRLLIDTINPRRVRSEPATQAPEVFDRQRFQKTIRSESQYIVFEWAISKNGAEQKVTVRQRLYPFEELSSMLETSGFRNITAYGGLDGSDYTDRSRRLVITASKLA